MQVKIETDVKREKCKYYTTSIKLSLILKIKHEINAKGIVFPNLSYDIVIMVIPTVFPIKIKTLLKPFFLITIIIQTSSLL